MHSRPQQQGGKGNSDVAGNTDILHETRYGGFGPQHVSLPELPRRVSPEWPVFPSPCCTNDQTLAAFFGLRAHAAQLLTPLVRARTRISPQSPRRPGSGNDFKLRVGLRREKHGETNVAK